MDEDIDPPPFFRTWKRLYTAILLYVCTLIAVFALFGKIFNR